MVFFDYLPNLISKIQMKFFGYYEMEVKENEVFILITLNNCKKIKEMLDSDYFNID